MPAASVGCLLALALIVLPSALTGQEDRWSAAADVGVNWSFGSARQSAFTTEVTAERADSLLEFSARARYRYGEASDGDDTFVNKRSWVANAGFDFRPQDRITPFAFGSFEQTLEQRIQGRASGGAGAKYSFIREGDRRLDVSLALLAEWTKPRPLDGVVQEAVTVGRWSTRFRYRTSTEDQRVTFSAITWYRPAMNRFGNYTIDLETALGVKISRTVSLKISLIDRYDSLAISRGAASNTDGHLLVGFTKTF